MWKVEFYVADDGSSPVQDWLAGLRDFQGRNRIRRRLGLLRLGSLGDYRSVGHGLCELRVDSGPGYRVYFARRGAAFIVLLCGGDKGSQRRDIVRAYWFWEEFRRRDER